MQNFLQTDSRWANLTFQGLKYKDYGCFVTSLGNMVDLDPVTTANKLIAGSGLINGLIQSEKAAQILGLDYFGVSQTKPDYDCIAETLYYDKASTPAKEQHFFILKDDGSQVDPLGKNIKYPISSYRLFKRKDNMGDFESTNEALRQCQITLGSREATILALQKSSSDYEGQIAGLKGQVASLQKQLENEQNKPAKEVMVPAVLSDGDQKILDLWHKFISIFKRK